MKKIITITALATCIAIPSLTMAGPIIMNSTLNQTQNFSFTSLSASTILDFTGFDATLGTLHAIHFEWATNKTIISEALNIGLTAQSVGSPEPVTATSTTTFAGLGIAVDLSDSNDLTTPDFVGTIERSTATIVNGFPVFSPLTIGSASESTSGSICLSNHADALCGSGTDDIQAYITNALLSFEMSVSNTSTIQGSLAPNIFVSNQGTVDGTVTIYYDYEANIQSANGVPEPTSVSLMGLGLALFATQGIIRRRKQTK